MENWHDIAGNMPHSSPLQTVYIYNKHDASFSRVYPSWVVGRTALKLYNLPYLTMIWKGPRRYGVTFTTQKYISHQAQRNLEQPVMTVLFTMQTGNQE